MDNTKKKYKLTGITEHAERYLMCEYLEDLKCMIGSYIEESENKAEVDGGKLFIMPDGKETHVVFLQIEEVFSLPNREVKESHLREEIQEKWYQNYRNSTTLSRFDAMNNAMEEYANLRIEQEVKKWSVEWISVKDRLPDIDETVLVYEKDGHIYSQCFTKILGFKCHSSVIDCVTHWQPLPKAPII